MSQGPGAEERVDVVICGGGLAGLTLALQLSREVPAASVAVLEPRQRPLPEAAFKVGESTTEMGSYYLAGVLGLEAYLEEAHLAKLGFRFFFGGEAERFSDRPEFGIRDFPVPTSYNFDRGILENDLRRFVQEAGVHLREGARVQDVALGAGEEPHRVVWTDDSRGERTLAARWVVDAMGRRRWLQGKLGLNRRRASDCSAAWFRVEGSVDVGDLVPPDATGWHERVPGGRRYKSVNHLVGRGYWVWLIPLPGGRTSIGIVTLDEIHPSTEFNRHDKALRWLERHEPHLAAHVADREPLDFQCIRRYSISSRRIFSADRWACVGDAAVFADPLYASATDLLGLENSAVCDLVRRDGEGRLPPGLAGQYSRTLIGVNDALTMNIQIAYRLFGNPSVAAAKVSWDTAVAWGLFAPRLFNGLFLDRSRAAPVQRITSRSFFLIERLQALFLQWKEKSSRSLGFDFINFLEIPYLKALRQRNLRPGKSAAELVEDAQANMDALEELAQVFFRLAVEDCLPELLPRVLEAGWVDAWAVSLRPERWQDEGLFAPSTPARVESLAEGYRAVRGLFSP